MDLLIDKFWRMFELRQHRFVHLVKSLEDKLPVKIITMSWTTGDRRYVHSIQIRKREFVSEITKISMWSDHLENLALQLNYLKQGAVNARVNIDDIFNVFLYMPEKAASKTIDNYALLSEALDLVDRKCDRIWSMFPRAKASFYNEQGEKTIDSLFDTVSLDSVFSRNTKDKVDLELAKRLDDLFVKDM